MNIQAVLEDCGLAGSAWSTVSGGDINQAFQVRMGAERYFLKVNHAQRYPGMFEKEARGLYALHATDTFEVPSIIRHGTASDMQYLLLEWIETGKPRNDFWEVFGQSLAALHRHSQRMFGWPEHNFMGSLVQSNNDHVSWEDFFMEERIAPLVQQLFDARTFSKQDLVFLDNFARSIRGVFPIEKPSLLHGDLWSGNFMITQQGKPALIDPASYYGHREMDIALTKLFGGFPDHFYGAYTEAYPLAGNWTERLPVAQLYPLLVHAVLFGGHYTDAARAILKQRT